MKATKRNSIITVALGASLALGCLSGAANGLLVYDNSQTDLSVDLYTEADVMVGDQVILDSSIVQRELKSFDFQYYSTEDVRIRVRLRENDGALVIGSDHTSGKPNTVLYNSGWFSVPADPTRGTIDFDSATLMAGNGGNPVVVPDSFTLEINLGGSFDDDVFALTLYDPPAVGSNWDDYWRNDPVNGWELLEIKNPTNEQTIPANFAARFYVVPEPTSIAFGIIFGGGALGFIVARRRAKKAA